MEIAREILEEVMEIERDMEGEVGQDHYQSIEETRENSRVAATQEELKYLLEISRTV